MSSWLAHLIAGLLWALAAYLLLISGYMAALCAGSWLLRSKGRGLPHGRVPSIAILVPAHNEEAGIATTVRDLLRSEYPAASREIFVIADNCSDRTAAAAAQAGASVIERFDTTNRGKGQALDWVLRSHAHTLERFDLVAFVDADMFVDPQFLAASAWAFAEPSVSVVQGRYTVSNPSSSWLSALGFMSFAYVNHVRPAGRTLFGGTAELKGSGMVFRRQLICETGWPAGSIAEDVDFGKELLFRGVRVVYAPSAIVTSDIPTSLRQVTVQQSRWEGGKLHVIRKFMGRTFRALVQAPSIALADALIDLIVPPLSAIILLALLGFGLALFLPAPPAWLFLVPLLVFGITVMSGLIQLRAPFRTYLYIACAPAFVIWKLVLLAKLATKPTETEWKRTPRDAEAARDADSASVDRKA